MSKSSRRRSPAPSPAAAAEWAGRWQKSFIGLREQFAAAVGSGRVRLLQASFAGREAATRRADEEWARDGGGAHKQHGSVRGDAAAVEQFVRLAGQSGNALPDELRLSYRLFPGASDLENDRPGGVTLWLEFLHITASEQFEIRSPHDTEVAAGGRWATLCDGADPFAVSVAAIDAFVRFFDDKTLEELCRRRDAVLRGMPRLAVPDIPPPRPPVPNADPTLGFLGVADGLPVVPGGPAEPRPEPATEIGGVDLGELMAAVRSLEHVRELQTGDRELWPDDHRRAVAACEALELVRLTPIFPRLEAYVNHAFGDVCHANLLKLHGALCAARNCGSDVADRMSLDEVGQALGFPGGAAGPGDKPDKKKRGGPVRSDPKEDRQVWDMRASGRFPTDASIARELGWLKKDGEPDGPRVRRALDRQRKRLARSPKAD